MGFDARLGFVVHLGRPAVAGRLLPAGRPRRPRHRRRHGGAAARGRGPRHLGLLRLAGLPARAAGPRHPGGARPSAGRPLSTAALETHVDLGRTRLETMLKVLDVDGAVRRVPGGWTATGREWVYDADRYAPGGRGPRAASRRRCWPTSTPTSCRMGFLRDQLDDPAAADCGRCDNCGGLSRRARASPSRPSPRRSSGSRGPGVVVEPRKMWPTGAGQPAARPQRAGSPRRRRRGGRWPGSPTSATAGCCGTCSGADTPDGPVPAAAGAGRARGARPTGGLRIEVVVAVESATRPLLVRDLADGLARHLGVPVVGAFAIVDPGVPPGQGAVNSAQRVAAVHRRQRLVVEPGSLEGGPCCWWTTGSITGWTPHPRRGGPARGGCRGGFPSGARRRVVTSAPRIGATVVP